MSLLLIASILLMPAINQQFWDILDKKLPDHEYEYVGCCAECGSFELRKTNARVSRVS